MKSNLLSATVKPGDPEWDNGEPPSEEGRARRRDNLAMLSHMQDGTRIYRVNRMVPTSGSRENPNLAPQSFLVRALSGTEAKRYVQERIDSILSN